MKNRSHLHWLIIGILLFAPWAVRTASAQGHLFSEPKTYPLEHAPQSIVSGDFNRDGQPDLAVSDGAGKHVLVYLGNGRGDFSAPRKIPASNTVTGMLLTGDFDRDGIMDLVVMNVARNSISLLRGTGDGGFQKARIVALVQDTATAVAADFNLDGKLDLVASSGFERKISVLLGDGKGGFGEPRFFPVGEGGNIRHMVTADFNKDGKPDVALSEETGHHVVILLGDGEGNFSAPTEFVFPEKSLPRGMAAADFNMDGRPDLAVITLSTVPKKVWILLGDGKGGFALNQTLFGNTSHWSLTTGDFNGDGKTDLGVFDLDDRVTLFVGQGGGLFSSPIPYYNPGAPADQFYNTIVAEDFNHDGYTDLAMASEVPPLVSVLLNGLGSATGTIMNEDFYRKPRPIQIAHLKINPKDPNVLYLVTVNQGVFRSRDKGVTWKPINIGIKNLLVYAMVIDHERPEILYIGTWGAGLYKSVNGGDSWDEIDEGLTHTAVNGLVMHPKDPKILYASTSMRVFKSLDAGSHWSPLESEGVTSPVSNVFSVPSLALLPSSDFLVGSDRGLQKWVEKDQAWTTIEGVLKDQFVTAMAYEPMSGTLYLTTRKFELLASADGGESWTRRSRENERVYAREIVIPQGQSRVMFILDESRGLTKSTDGGVTFNEINTGIENVKPRALAADPTNLNSLYLGTYADGVFISHDGGGSWSPVKDFPLQTIEEVLAPILASEKKTSTIPPPPPEFVKCNACHGWTEPNLKFFRKNYWQMKPSARDWGLTVMRMGRNADLTPEETANILKFMNTYYGLPKQK